MTYHKTAISRKALSVPMRVFQKKGLLQGRMLDFGCGRGYDATTLGMEKFDPNGFPFLPKGEFDTVTCIYVMNVIPATATRWKLERTIIGLLNPGGRGLLAIRDDVPEGGHVTSTGTWQGLVVPTKKWKPIVHRKKLYRLYEYMKEE
jgi:hypothetical protein